MELKEKLKLRKLIKELKSYKGRHTELVSVYIPSGYNLVDAVNMLRAEVSTAQNIKSKTTRKNVVEALEKILQHLKLFRETPPNGLVVFAGNVSQEEGKPDVRVWSIEPPEPLRTKLYWCDQVFVTEPLEEMLEEKDNYGLIVMDGSEAIIGVLSGKSIKKLKRIESLAPSKSVKGGMCVCEDTLIQLSDGNIIPIKNLIHNQKILSYSLKDMKPTYVDNFEIFKRKARVAYKLIFRYPSLHLTLTPEHIVFVVTENGIEEKSVEELRPGDKLLMICDIEVKGKTTNKSGKFYQLLGYITGDGTFENSRIIFYDKDKELLEFYAKIAGTTLGKKPKILRRRNTYEARIYSKKIANEISKKYKEITKQSRERDIPEEILKLPNNKLKFYLRGIFDAEGYIDKKSIGMRLSSEALAKKLHLLLLRFGIVSSLRGPDKYGRFELRITNPIMIKKFYQNIGFSSKKKMKKLQELLRKHKMSYSFKAPVNGLLVRKIIEEMGLKKEDIKKYSMFLCGKRNISYPIFKKLVKEVERKVRDKKYLSLLKRMLDSKLISITLYQKLKIKTNKKFYDLYVPSTNSFIAQGILVHNSQRRYDRIREQALIEYYRKVGEIASKLFLDLPNLKGVIIGGPGPIKERFYEGDYLDHRIREKVLGVKSVGYVNEYGLEELVKRSEDLIQEAEIMKERKLLQQFFANIHKKGDKIVYGLQDTLKALEIGALDTIMISEDFDYVKRKIKKNGKEEIVYQKENESYEGELVEEIDLLEEIEKLAKQFGTKIEFISDSTNEGRQFKNLGGIGGLLRYRIKDLQAG